MDASLKVFIALIIAGYVLLHLSLWRAQERQRANEMKAG